MICPRCDTKNSNDTPFCSKCGNPLSKSAVNSPSYQPSPSVPFQVPAPPRPVKSSGWPKLVAIAVTGLLAIGFVVLGVLSVFRVTGGIQYIVYQTESFGKYDLWVARANGSQPIRVFEGAQSISYPYDYDYDQSQLGNSSSYSLNHTPFGTDGKTIYFTTTGSKGNTLWRVDVTGNDLQALFNNLDSGVGFVNGGKNLLLQVKESNNNISRLITYSLEAKTSKEIFTSGSSDTSSSGSNKITDQISFTYKVAGAKVFMSVNSRNVNGQSLTSYKLLDLDGGLVDINPPQLVITRDSLYPTATSAPTTIRGVTLTPTPSPSPVVALPDVRKVVELTSVSPVFSDSKLSWYYDTYEIGKSYNSSNQKHQLYLTDLNGANPKLIYEGSEITTVTDAGTERMLATYRTQDSSRLVSITSDGKIQMISDPYLYGDSGFLVGGTASNKKVFYAQYPLNSDGSQSNAYNYFVEDVKGEKRVRLSTRKSDSLFWSSDAKYMLVGGEIDSGVYRLSLVQTDNGSDAELWRGTSSSSYIPNGNYSFSPDGKWMTYELKENTSSSSKKVTIYLVNLQSGKYERTEFMRGAFALAWSRNF